MGEFADDCLDRCYDYDDSLSRYWSGELSHDEAVEAGVIDEDGYVYGPGIQKPVTCRYCGKTGLFWDKLKGNWLLHDSKGVHKCKKQHVARVSCRCCGKSGLLWRKVSGKWLLHEGDVIHDCPVSPLRGYDEF